MPLDCPVSVQDVFGPVVDGCGSDFDFTLLFEESILFILPLIITTILAILELARRYNHQALYRGGILLALKLVSWIALLASQIAFLVLISANGPRTRASTAAGGIGVALTLILTACSYVQHRNAARSSSVIVLYLLGTLPMDILRARTLWDTQNGRGAAISMICYASFKLCAFILEITWKCSHATQSGLCDAPEEKHGIIERAFMLRAIPMFSKGYRTPLQAKDLYNIDARLMNGNAKGADTSRLVTNIFTSHLPEVLDPILPRLYYLALQFAQPFLVERAIELISNPRGRNFYLNGGGLIAAYGLVYIGIGVMASTYEGKAARAATVIRADLSSRIFQQSLKLDRIVVSKDSSTTMITADVDRVQSGIRKMHDFWANLATIGIGLWLIESRLGASSLLTLAVIVANEPRFSHPYWMRWMEAMETRLHKTVQVFKGIKSIKQMGATQPIFDLLRADRTSEIQLSKYFRLQMIAIITLSFSSLTTLPSVGLVLPVALSNGRSGQLLDARAAFAALTLFQLVSAAIQDGAAHGMQLMVGIGSLQRVQAALNQHIWKDGRRSIGNESTDSIATGSIKLSSADNSHEKEPSEKHRDRDVAVTLDKVITKWSEESDVVGKEISFNVPRNGLTVLYGPTGSGKSTLLGLMTGDSAPVSGKVSTMDQQIGFCDQPPWIANLSIRDNIVGALHFDEKMYHMVLETCALDRDIRELGDGDQHICGLNGQSVSGGQKARIALARTIYSRASLVILDDCFVGLDGRTESFILDKIFGPDGVLNARTTILATSSPKYLALANHIITIDANCNVVREGPYLDAALTINQIEQPESQHQRIAPMSLEDDDAELIRAASDANDTNKPASSEWAVYQWYFRAAGSLNFMVFLVLCSFFVVGVIYPQVFLRSWTEKTLQGQRSTLPTFYGVFFGVGSMAWIAFAGACVYLFLQMAVRVAASFHTMLLDTMLNASMEFFSTTDSGRTLNRFSQDLQIIDMELPLAFIGTTISSLTVIAQCAVIIVELPWTGFAVLGLAIALFLVFRIYLRTTRRLRLLDIELKSPVLSLLIESIDGLATVRSFGWTEWYSRRGLRVLGEAQVPFHLLQTAQITLNLWLDLLVAILAIVVVSIAIGTGNSSGGSLGLALLNIVGLGQSVRIVVHFYTSLEITLGAVARIRDFTLGTGSENIGKDEPSPDWPLKGSIQFQNVTISHSSSLPPIIEGLELNVEAGSKVAICGRTGSGKTTLANSLLQLVNVSTGKILIDGIDIATLRPKDIRSRLVALPQETLKLSVDIRKYAQIYGVPNDEDIIQGLTAVGLWPTIERAGGLDMLLTDESLSHGQRQLLGMTLACLRRGKVVLMDEPTSNVDVDIQSQLQRAVFETFADSTVVCITHQIDTILDFDLAIVLDRGKIVEQGKPRELLEKEGSRLRQLYSMQNTEAAMAEKVTGGVDVE
ncbi:P-loop containing nucleoside triphosphate hydrolase protein [Leptodontidium sp. MPI-SDFR-AT-0119]|nr:P-loop containing nucleoside triphosphate hydrolase protein [Leptodontidium sp. MPI-SDFR-AT-0119]